MSTFQETEFRKLVRDALQVPLMDIAKGLAKAKEAGVPALDGVGAAMANGYAINVKHDRDGWNLRKGKEMAERWRTEHPQVAEAERKLLGFVDPPVAAPAAPEGARIYVLEIRWPSNSPDHGRLASEVMMVGSSEQKLVDHVKTPRVGKPIEYEWFWSLFSVQLDDPRMIPSGWRHFDREGNEHSTVAEAHEAGVAMGPRP